MTSMLARCRCKRKSAIVGVPFADHGFSSGRFRTGGRALAERYASAEASGPRTRRFQVLGAPGRAWAAHIVQFGAIGIERLDNELPPKTSDFAENTRGLAGVLRRSRGER